MAAALVTEAYGQSLRLLAAHHGVHYQGLAAAARKVPGLSPSLRRRLQRLDTTYQIVRHITEPYISQMMTELEACLVVKVAAEEPVVAEVHVTAAEKVADVAEAEVVKEMEHMEELVVEDTKVQEAWKVAPPSPKRYCFRRSFMIPCRACGRDSLFGLCGDCTSATANREFPPNRPQGGAEPAAVCAVLNKLEEKLLKYPRTV